MANYFSILLTVLTLLTGVLWAIDKWKLRPLREAKQAEEAKRLNVNALDDSAKHAIAPQPWWGEYSEAIFPIVAVILVLRSFLYEPFQIPSGSMMPTLLRGDFILVEKFSYSLRDPVARKELLEINRPERGDIAVFKYPPEPTIDYIKRVVGLPGDRIIYRDKQLYIQPRCVQSNDENGDQEQCPKHRVIGQEAAGNGEYFRGPYPLNRYRETLGEVTHDILVNPAFSNDSSRYLSQVGTASDEWIVPEGHYFMMGDNRDNSEDSRYWGFVHEDLLVGEAVFIWMSFDMDRDRDSWLPQWVPTGIRFERLGTIE